MESKRRCTKSGCSQLAKATLTYSYQDSTMVVGPLSVYAEPHSYDLCHYHAQRVTPPRGWETLRLTQQIEDEDSTPTQDLFALAQAVRSQQRPGHSARTAPQNTNAETTAQSPAGESQTDAAASESSGAGQRAQKQRLNEPPQGAGIHRGHLRLIRE